MSERQKSLFSPKCKFSNADPSTCKKHIKMAKADGAYTIVYLLLLSAATKLGSGCLRSEETMSARGRCHERSGEPSEYIGSSLSFLATCSKTTK